MPVRPCLTCGVLTTRSYCPAHRPSSQTRQTPGRTNPREFRRLALEYAGDRCEFVNDDGQRCTERTRLEAHHVIGLRDGGDNNAQTNSLVLCRRHHRLVEQVLQGRRIL